MQTASLAGGGRGRSSMSRLPCARSRLPFCFKSHSRSSSPRRVTTCSRSGSPVAIMDDDEQHGLIYHKKLRRHVAVPEEQQGEVDSSSSATPTSPLSSSPPPPLPPSSSFPTVAVAAWATEAAPVSPDSSSNSRKASSCIRDETVKIARPIPLTPTPVNGLHHHPHRNSWLYAASTPHLSMAPTNSSSSANYLYHSPYPTPSGLLSHHGFTPPRIHSNASPASASPTILISPEVELTRVAPSTAAVTIILSDMRNELSRGPPPPRQGPPTLPTVPVDPTMAEDMGPNAQPRQQRKQKPDDLVPPGCGLTRDDIVCAPIDDFNDKVADKSESEILLLKDRRRRGKNRIAARKSREKKNERLRCLRDEYKKLNRDNEEFERRKQATQSTKESLRHSLTKIEAEIARFKEKLWRQYRMYEKRM